MNLYNIVSSKMSINDIMPYVTFWDGFFHAAQFCGDSAGCCMYGQFNAFQVSTTHDVGGPRVAESTIKGHLSSFQVLINMSKAAINLCVQSFCVNISLHLFGMNAQQDNYWVIRQSYIQAFFVCFKETSRLFSRVVVPFYIPIYIV